MSAKYISYKWHFAHMLSVYMMTILSVQLYKLNKYILHFFNRSMVLGKTANSTSSQKLTGFDCSKFNEL